MRQDIKKSNKQMIEKQVKKQVKKQMIEKGIKQNNNYSYNLHSFCEGCKQCVKGRKTVIYITGLCPRKCYYCPLSDNKRFKDVMYANERKIKDIKEIADEVKISKSTGAGITGGDPLLKLNRTCLVIKQLKKKFGKKFHIHLYTSFDLVDNKVFKKLHDAGLDEIRFHPDLDDEKLWDRIKLAKKFKWKVGVEIPCIPGYYNQTWKMIKFTQLYIDFLNINELEVSDTNGNTLNEKGFVCKDKYSYAIKGSNEMALKLLAKVKKEYPKLGVHYCTSKLKDRVQMGNRLKIRAESIKKPYDLVNDEGMIIRGFIEADECVVKELIELFKIPKKLIAYDVNKKNIAIASWVLMDIYKELPYKSAIVTEYPTWDRMIVELEYLNKD